MEATGMRHIRIGKDIRLQWAITTGGAAEPLEGRDLTIEMKSPIGKVIILPYRLEGNVLIITYYGYEQTVVGEYSLTLWENKGKPGQNVVDAIRAFKLVRTSPEEEDFIGGDLQVESVDLGTANLEILSGGGASTPGESPDLSALEGKVAANTASISNINEELDNVKEVQDGQNNSIAQINTTLEEHGESISRLDSITSEHSNSIAQINTKLGEHTDSISELKSSSSLHGTSIDAINAQVHSQGKSIGSIEGKLAEHSESIRQASIAIEGNSSSIADIRAMHNSDVDAINDILDEHTQSINTTSDIVIGHTSEITSIKTEQTEQNNRLNNHEERLVYTESDLVKVREEYNSIISEIVKSIAHTQKAFVVETGDRKGHIYVDSKNKEIPPKSIKAFYFSSSFGSSGNSGITNFRFLVTNTSGITNMGFMFNGYSELTALDVSNFDTGNVTSMNHMFSGCSSLTSLDVSNFDTRKVTEFGDMFSGCSSLTSLDLSNFDTRASTSMGYMFSGCSSLTSLDLSNFSTSLVKSMRHMFNGCTSLTSLYLSNFDTSSIEKIENMFYGCTSLNSLILGPNFFKNSAVTIIDFSSCAKWTNDTVVTSLVTNSYDRAAAGLNTLTLQLHAKTKAALTDEQKATITNKGYTIA